MKMEFLGEEIEIKIPEHSDQTDFLILKNLSEIIQNPEKISTKRTVDFGNIERILEILIDFNFVIEITRENFKNVFPNFSSEWTFCNCFITSDRYIFSKQTTYDPESPLTFEMSLIKTGWKPNPDPYYDMTLRKKFL